MTAAASRGDSMRLMDQYDRGEPVVAITPHGYRSFVMGLVFHEDGLSWCDDSVLNDMNSRHPYHHLDDKVVNHGWMLCCAGVRFVPLDRWHRRAMHQWRGVLACRPDIVGARRYQEEQLVNDRTPPGDEG